MILNLTLLTLKSWQDLVCTVDFESSPQKIPLETMSHIVKNKITKIKTMIRKKNIHFVAIFRLLVSEYTKSTLISV